MAGRAMLPTAGRARRLLATTVLAVTAAWLSHKAIRPRIAAVPGRAPSWSSLARPALVRGTRGARAGRGSKLARPAAAEEGPGEAYEVALAKQRGDKLGLRLEHEVNGAQLFVTNVAEGLLCDRWNAANPDSAVTPGDVVLQVNDVQGDPILMREEFKKEGALRVRLLRGGGKVASEERRLALVSKNVMVAPSTIHGFGVFAAKDFAEKEVLHESPGRLIRDNTTALTDDVFEIGWDDPDADQLSILGLGFASLHNHAEKPNAEVLWEKSEKHGGLLVGTFYTLRPVSRGEELFIHYGDKWWSDRANRTNAE